MTRIRVVCRSCGIVDLSPAEVVVVLSDGQHELAFRHCRLQQSRPLGSIAVRMLATVGVDQVSDENLPTRVRSAIAARAASARASEVERFRDQLALVSTVDDLPW